MAFNSSSISNETNDHKDRRYKFYYDDSRALSKYAGGRFDQADFKTNFTVEGDLETGYKVCLLYQKFNVLFIFLLNIHLS